MSLSGGGRKYLSRWTISAAVVVFAHLGIAGAVLTWHKVMAPEEFPAPVVVNLIPEPPLPPQTERGPIASKGASEKPSEQVPGQRDDGTASKREQRIEPKPVEQPSVTVTIPQSEGGKTELGVDTRRRTGAPNRSRRQQPNRHGQSWHAIQQRRQTERSPAGARGSARQTGDAPWGASPTVRGVPQRPTQCDWRVTGRARRSHRYNWIKCGRTGDWHQPPGDECDRGHCCPFAERQTRPDRSSRLQHCRVAEFRYQRDGFATPRVRQLIDRWPR